MTDLPLISILGLSALTMWACLWFVLAGRARIKKRSSSFHFWQMTRWWSVINMAIVLFSAILLWTQQSTLADPALAPAFWNTMRSIVFLNVWLDVGYILIGWLLSVLHGKKQTNRLQGYGLAIMAQGAGLFVIDVVLYNGLSGR